MVCLETVLRTRFCGSGSVAPVSAAPPGRYTPHSKKNRTFRDGVLFKTQKQKAQFPTLTWGDPTLPSALRRFTSEFGMGSGGTTALSPPGKFCCQKRILYTYAALAAFAKSVTYLSMRLPFLHLPPCLSVKSFVPDNPESKLKISQIRQNIFGVVRLSLTVH